MDVHENHIETALRNLVKNTLTVADDHDLVPSLFQKSLDQLLVHDVVFGQQDVQDSPVGAWSAILVWLCSRFDLDGGPRRELERRGEIE